MIEDFKVSHFKKTTDTEAQPPVAIGEWLDKIEAGEYYNQITELRAGNTDVKTRLPTVAMHGVFDGFRKKENFIEASGIIILDFDDVDPEDFKFAKDEIMEDDNVLACMISPSGNGIKVLYYVEASLVSADNYREIGKEVLKRFDDYGHIDFLSVTDTLIMTYDEDIRINYDAVPAFIHIEEKVKEKFELESLDPDKDLWEDPEDFFDTVLADDIASKTNNNYHYIQVAILDMKKFGWEHPKEDLSFIIDYAESVFKSSASNKTRFDEVVEVAKQYDQIKWAYRLEQKQAEEEYNDYSAFQDDEEDVEQEGEEVESNGLIDYGPELFKSVMSVIDEGPRVGYEISLSNFAEEFRPRGTGICTITGIPSHGKTEFVDQITLDLARLYGHETIVAGYEQRHEEHLIKQMRRLIGTDITCPSWRKIKGNDKVINQAFKFITDKFKHVDITQVGGDINKVLEVIAKRIKVARDEGADPKWVVIDPFNMLSVKGKFSGHEKVEELLRRITHFSHQMNVMVFLVAHPFKMKKDDKTGEYAVPDFYSVKGSSAFYEMSYHGLVIFRMNNQVMVKVLKVKQNNMGNRDGEAFFSYHRASGRYIPMDENENELGGDHHKKDWLEKIK